MLPQKESWRRLLKRQGKFGLSASQFGAALGHCGRVSDFIDYLRNIVGTEQEFRGNAATAHGIRSEAIARLVYELLLRSPVQEGGFYIDRFENQNGEICDHAQLACSPDGVVLFLDEEGKETPDPFPPVDETRTITPPPNMAEVQEPVTQPRGGHHQQQTPVIEVYKTRRRPKRLLEIKCPFKNWYSGAKEENQPFGIPLHYMCQMQGQMAISGATECDFFVMLRYPKMQCVAWRVYFSHEFWDWAKPKLLQVSEWVSVPNDLFQSEISPFMNRKFVFPHFNYGKIAVHPLIPPVDLACGIPINLSSQMMQTTFPFFAACITQPLLQTIHDPCSSPLLGVMAKKHIEIGDLVFCQFPNFVVQAASVFPGLYPIAVGEVIDFSTCSTHFIPAMTSIHKPFGEVVTIASVTKMDCIIWEPAALNLLVKRQSPLQVGDAVLSLCGCDSYEDWGTACVKIATAPPMYVAQPAVTMDQVEECCVLLSQQKIGSPVLDDDAAAQGEETHFCCPRAYLAPVFTSVWNLPHQAIATFVSFSSHCVIFSGLEDVEWLQRTEAHKAMAPLNWLFGTHIAACEGRGFSIVFAPSEWFSAITKKVFGNRCSPFFCEESESSSSVILAPFPTPSTASSPLGSDSIAMDPLQVAANAQLWIAVGNYPPQVATPAQSNCATAWSHLEWNQLCCLIRPLIQ